MQSTNYKITYFFNAYFFIYKGIYMCIYTTSPTVVNLNLSPALLPILKYHEITIDINIYFEYSYLLKYIVHTV